MKEMMGLHNLIEDQLKHNKKAGDILAVLAYDVGNLFASAKDDQPFEVLLHTFICNIYKGKQAWEEEEKNESID